MFWEFGKLSYIFNPLRFLNICTNFGVLEFCTLKKQKFCWFFCVLECLTFNAKIIFVNQVCVLQNELIKLKSWIVLSALNKIIMFKII